jgi:hypothetical protein
VILESEGTDTGRVRQQQGFASFRTGAGAIPDARVATAAGREPLGIVTERKLFQFRFVAAHVKFIIFRGHPQMHGVVMAARHQPPIIGRPGQCMDRVAVGKFFFDGEGAGVPTANAPEVGGRAHRTIGSPCECGDRFWCVRKSVGKGTVVAKR